MREVVGIGLLVSVQTNIYLDNVFSKNNYNCDFVTRNTYRTEKNVGFCQTSFCNRHMKEILMGI